MLPKNKGQEIITRAILAIICKVAITSEQIHHEQLQDIQWKLMATTCDESTNPVTFYGNGNNSEKSQQN